jgi:predicted CXXCH cytochrome family protein
MNPSHKTYRSSMREARRDAVGWALPTILMVAPAVLLACAASAVGQAPARLLPDSATDGWRVFARKHCIECHAVWGLGGEVGPDLGRTEPQNLTPARLAADLWNHIPTMYSHMRRYHLEFPVLSQQETSDLFSFLLLLQFLDEPGDPAMGQRILHEKGCTACHAIDGPQRIGPDLKRWAAYTNPIVWAQKMWEHAPEMDQAMQQTGVARPVLADTDLAHIIAYLRSVGGHEGKVYLEPGSARRGARLFTERGCQTCHRPGGVGTDLTRIELPRSLSGLAARMWNHSPEMTRMMQTRGLPRSALTAQDMADIISYVVSLGYHDPSGDVQRGRAVFSAKRCSQCHAGHDHEDAQAPGLEILSASADPVRLAHAMWNHGLTMMDQMSEAGLSWPTFQPEEMVDLIAYLKSTTPAFERPAATRLHVPTRASAPVREWRPPPVDLNASCASNECHPGLVAGRVLHAPTAQGECLRCHAPVDPESHRFQLVGRDSDLCYACHDGPPETLRALGPVAIGVCTACHNPHGAENLFGPNFTGKEICFADLLGTASALETMLDLPPSRPAEPVEISHRVDDAIEPPGAPVGLPPAHRVEGGCATAECHTVLLSGAFVHGPTAQQQCEYCHQLVDAQSHRFRLTSREPDLCYECHDRPDLTTYQHGPVALGACTACHDPHSAPYQYFMPESGAALCFTCHTELGDHVHRARVQHGVIEKEGCLACHDPHRGNRPLLLKGDVPDLCYQCHDSIRSTVETAVVSHEPVDAGKKCLQCHNPHGSDVPQILTDVEMNLCLGCHNQPMDTPHGAIIDMHAWIENNPEHHGPIRDGNCSACHQPHGSQHFRILRHSFPKTFYSPFSIGIYDLCFECHEPTITLDERTTTLTDFRDGDKNLHYLHVNHEKGRTCRACHEIHAGTKPKRIRDSVPFGRWVFPVNFEKTEHGGRCAPGCHVERSYDRRPEIVRSPETRRGVVP